MFVNKDLKEIQWSNGIMQAKGGVVVRISRCF